MYQKCLTPRQLESVGTVYTYRYGLHVCVNRLTHARILVYEDFAKPPQFYA